MMTELNYKLKREAELIWIVYNQDVFNELKKKNIKNIILSNLGIKYLNSFNCAFMLQFFG